MDHPRSPGPRPRLLPFLATGGSFLAPRPLAPSALPWLPSARRPKPLAPVLFPASVSSLSLSSLNKPPLFCAFVHTVPPTKYVLWFFRGHLLFLETAASLHPGKAQRTLPLQAERRLPRPWPSGAGWGVSPSCLSESLLEQRIPGSSYHERNH